MGKKLSLGVAAGAILAASLLAGPSSAAVQVNMDGSAKVTFVAITHNNGLNTNIAANQFYVDVTDGGSNTVNFAFHNVGSPGIQAEAAEIYFQDGTLLGISSITNNAQSTFFTSNPLNPGHLSSGNNLNPEFLITAAFSVDSDTPGNPPNIGLNLNQGPVTIKFNLLAGKTFADTVNALVSAYNNPSGSFNPNGTDKAGGADGLRIGMHVKSIAGGGSDTYYSGISDPLDPGAGGPVPEPATLAIWGLGLGIAGLVRLRRNKLAA